VLERYLKSRSYALDDSRYRNDLLFRATALGKRRSLNKIVKMKVPGASGIFRGGHSASARPSIFSLSHKQDRHSPG